jgi:DNA-binding transcriptional regulator YdaS (Cro superfamily)
MDYYRIRLRHVEAILRDEFEGSQTAFAEEIGVAESTVSRWFMQGPGRKNIGEKNARRIESSLGLAIGALDRKEMAKEEFVRTLTPTDPNLAKIFDRWRNVSDITKGRVLQLIDDDVEK